MFELSNVMRNYAWGSTTAIAELLGRTPGAQPEAELWMGAHVDSPSIAQTTAGPIPLDKLIADNPLATLGADVEAQFGSKLPFLCKLLAAETALSLQVHPTLSQAKERFQAEELAGIPSGAAWRNYKDDNHKPEMIFALSEFHALCGFRHCADAAQLFAKVRQALVDSGSSSPALLEEIISTLNSRMVEQAVIRQAFTKLIAGGEAAAALVDDAAAALRSRFDSDPDYPRDPALLTVVELAVQYPADPGVLISLLLNRITLEPGQAIYLPAGNIHAYLHGLGLEVMASSDNVLRGGLTGKHVDVPELLNTVDFQPSVVPYVPVSKSHLGQELLEPPFAEFVVQRLELSADSEPIPVVQRGPVILICISGSVRLDSPQSERVMVRGGTVFVPANEEPVMVHPHGEDSRVFAVTVAQAPSA